MRTAILASLLFITAPGMTAPPSVDQIAAWYEAQPWMKANTPQGEFYCLKREIAEGVDAAFGLLVKKIKDGVCV